MVQHLESILKFDNLEAIVRNGGFKTDSEFFIYTTGKIGPYYISSQNITKDSDDYYHAVNAISTLISTTLHHDYDIISGGESRDWIFSYPVASSWERKPHVSLYKDGRIEGANLEGKEVIHVADLNNTGNSIKKWTEMIRTAGGEIENVVFYVDRMSEEGKKVLEELGLKASSVVSLDKEAWDFLLRMRVLTEERYNSIIQWQSDKEKWARNMLLSEEGIAQMDEYWRNPSKSVREKAKKTLEIGYPSIKEEIAKYLIIL